MRIEFLKMQGLGNDFLVFDAPASAGGRLDPDTVRALADRHTGVGFDQALMLEAPRDTRHRISYRVFNSDGSEALQCGNGARCIAALLYARAPQHGRELAMESKGGLVHARVREDGLVSVDMGIPNFDPSAVPLDAPVEALRYSLVIDGVANDGVANDGVIVDGGAGNDGAAGETVECGAVSMGNPHAVLRVADVDSAPVSRLGAAIERHRWFPERANVGFMQIVNRGRIRLRVFERGVGETLACGTGACAAVAVGRRWELLDEDVQVDLPGGSAFVSWAGPGQRSWLTGPATPVFTGMIEI